MLLEVLIKYYSSQYEQLTDVVEEHTAFPVSKFDSQVKRMIVAMSKAPTKFDEMPEERRRELSWSLSDWRTPTKNLMAILYIYHREFKKLGPYYGSTRDIHNLWIIKPASNARGNGIFLSPNLGDIVKEDKIDKVGMDTVVQKYLETPLLLQLGNNYYKFDIRQWVLVTSLKPLTVYIFTGFYCRLCSQPFDIKKYQDSSRHLTNYSVNKSMFKEGKSDLQSSVLDDQFLKKYVLDRHNTDWESVLQPKIEQIVIESLRACHKEMKPRERSFEILGFDILFNDRLQPYLLEVNLSPACDEREEFLTRMLDEMTGSLFEVLKEKELRHQESTRLLIEREENERKEKEMRELAKSGLGESMFLGGASALGKSRMFGTQQEGKNGAGIKQPENRTVQLCPTFSKLHLGAQGGYRWKHILTDDNTDDLILRPGNDKYMIVEGTAQNVKAERHLDSRIKQR